MEEIFEKSKTGMRKEKAPAIMAMAIMLEGKRKGRPKKRWIEIVEEDGCYENSLRKGKSEGSAASNS